MITASSLRGVPTVAKMEEYHGDNTPARHRAMVLSLFCRRYACWNFCWVTVLGSTLDHCMKHLSTDDRARNLADYAAREQEVVRDQDGRCTKCHGIECECTELGEY